MKKTFGDLAYAQQFRDMIKQMIRTELGIERPKAVLGTVVNFSRITNSCSVLLVGETVPVTVKMSTIQPGAGGDIVRIEGNADSRYIAEVVRGKGVVVASSAGVLIRSPGGRIFKLVVDEGGTLSTQTVI